MTVQLIISFNVKDEKLTEFEQLMQQVKSSLPRVVGCDAVHIYHSKADRRAFMLIETWQSEKAHRAHVENLMLSGGWDHLRRHLRSDPVSSYFELL